MIIAESRVDHSLAEKVARLRQREAYPDRPSDIVAIETHMSWVFLAGACAYKMKKPVRHDYLDFSTLESRAHNCHEEVRLNQRLAPGVYLGVVPLAATERGELRLEVQGEVVEWLVKMRRLDQDRMLDRLIVTRKVTEAHVRTLGELLATFYRDATPAAMNADDYRREFDEALRMNQRMLSDPLFKLPPAQIEAVHAALLAHLARNDAAFAARAGHIVEGHGDLRPEHICLQTPAVIYDRLEFNRRFRLVDPIDELSFLAMECERLGAPTLGGTLFDVYAEYSGDRPPPLLRHWYMAQRACLRARLAAGHLRDCPPAAWRRWLTEAAKYLQIAERHCRAFGD